MSAELWAKDRLTQVAATPRAIYRLDQCLFYHSMDLPVHGFVEGQWDLRGREGVYLGNVWLEGKRVLELGTADGFLTFYMERQGAKVVSYDLSPEYAWDSVPYARRNSESEGNWVSRPQTFRDRIQRINNAYWLCHRAFRSNAVLVHGNVYEIPGEIGPVDITTVGALLLHTRDPFAALASAVRLTRETVIVTELRSRFHSPMLSRTSRLLPQRLRQPAMRFLPEWERADGADGWWRLSPEIVVSFLGVLGFEKTDVLYHSQPYKGTPHRMFTVVGHRTVG